MVYIHIFTDYYNYFLLSFAEHIDNIEIVG